MRTMKWWGWGDENVEFDISNRPNLWPYLRRVCGLPDNAPLTRPVPLESITLPPQNAHPAFAADAAALLADRLQSGTHERLTHAFGKSLRDLWRLRHGLVPYAPDYVAFPASHDEVAALLALAVRHQVHLIPFGGGSNIAGCLEPRKPSARPVVSVDMRRMNRLLALDRESETARFEAGEVVDPETLRERGLAIRPLPVKVLGNGKIDRALSVRVDAFSASARAAIVAAGGRADTLAELAEAGQEG